jgi:hypothetical protein
MDNQMMIIMKKMGAMKMKKNIMKIMEVIRMINKKINKKIKVTRR